MEGFATSFLVGEAAFSIYLLALDPCFSRGTLSYEDSPSWLSSELYSASGFFSDGPLIVFLYA